MFTAFDSQFRFLSRAVRQLSRSGELLRSRGGLFAFALLLLFVNHLPVLGQDGVMVPPVDAANEKTAPPEKAPAATVKQMPSDVFCLWDKNGQLQYILGLPYEDFLEWVDAKSGNETDQYPIGEITQMHIDAKALRENSAELTVTIELVASDEKLVTVPLRLDEAILSEPTRQVRSAPNEDPLKIRTLAPRNGEGYILYVAQPETPLPVAASTTELGETVTVAKKKAKPTSYHIELKMLVAVENIGKMHRIELQLPVSTVTSLTLKSEHTGCVASVEGGLLRKTTSLPSEKKTQFDIVSRGGSLALTWQEKDSSTTVATDQFETQTEIIAKISEASVLWDTTLHINPIGATMVKQLEVTLPYEAEITSLDTSAYELLAGQNRKKEEAKTVLVRFHEVQAEPFSIRLTAKRIFPEVQRGKDQRQAGVVRSADLGGFEVLNSVRQWGNIAIEGDTSDQINLQPNKVRRIKPPAQLQTASLLACYEFDTMPFNLTAAIEPVKTHVRVKPEYQLRVNADQLELTARYIFSVRGSRVEELSIELAGWELLSVGPKNTASLEMATFSKSSRGQQIVTIPLLQSATGLVELQLEAIQPLPPQEKPIQVRFPELSNSKSFSKSEERGIVKSSDPAIVTVFSVNNIRLLPKQSVYLTEPIGTLPKPAWATQQKALYYRGLKEFIANYEKLSQKYRVTSVTECRIEEDSVYLEEKLEYEILYVPTSQISLWVPNELLQQNDLLEVEYLVNGKPLLPHLAGKSNPTASQGTPVLPKTKADSKAAIPSTLASENTASLSAPLAPEISHKTGTQSSEASENSSASAPPSGVVPSADAAVAPRSGRTLIQLDLPQAAIGKTEVVIRRKLRLTEATLQQGQALSLPLTLLENGGLHSRRKLEMVSPSELLINVDEPWELERRYQSATVASPEGNPPSAKSATDSVPTKEGAAPEKADVETLPEFMHYVYSAPAATDHLHITAKRESFRQASEQVYVERAWLQTWMSHDSRRDRWVILFGTNTRELRFQLQDSQGIFPEITGMLLRKVERKNGAISQADSGLENPQWEMDKQGVVRVLLPAIDDEKPGLMAGGNAKNTTHFARYVLDVRIQQEHASSRSGQVAMEMPTIQGKYYVEQYYWLLALGPNEHLLTNGNASAPDMSWEWQFPVFGRKALHDAAWLEAWTGSTKANPLPEKTNVYLFSGFGDAQGVSVRVVSKSVLVFFSSGFALVLGLLLIHYPRIRRFWIWLVLGLFFFIAGLLYPEPTILLAQSAALGLVVAIFAGTLHQIVLLQRRKIDLILDDTSQINSNTRTNVTNLHNATEEPS